MWIMEFYLVQSIDPLLFFMHMDKDIPIELLGDNRLNYGDISFGLESAHDEDMNHGPNGECSEYCLLYPQCGYRIVVQIL